MGRFRIAQSSYTVGMWVLREGTHAVTDDLAKESKER
jgi:hypothetical protein